MITNHPRPPTELVILESTAEYGNTINPYTYLNTNRHGMKRFSASATGWTTVIDIQGAGIIQFVTIAVDNSSGAAITYGARMTVDGNIIYTKQGLSLPAGEEVGIPLAGLILWDDTPNEPLAAAADMMIFERNLKLEMYISTLTSASLLAVYRYYLTT